MELLERQSALANMLQFAAEAAAGDGRLVLIAGEAGVGKTTLIERLQRDVPDARWAWGACDGLFTPRPLAPLFDLAVQLGGELEDLFRAGADRDRLFGALLRQLHDPGAPHVLVVEDVHWADEATTDLLRFLGRRLSGAPVLLIATYRDDSVPPSHPLRVALGDLATVRSTRRLELSPLSAEGVRELAARSGHDPQELYRLTGGNPFFITEVLQAGIDVVPAAARDAVLARAARLDAAARDLLDLAALTGTRVEPEMLAAARPGSASLIDAILASGLLTEDGRWLKFRHEIARLAVEGAVRAHRRGQMHAEILAGLEALGIADDARLAFHAEGAGDSAAVVRYAVPAARRAADLASHQEAAAQFRRALRFAEAAGAGPVVMGALYEGLAIESSLIDRWEEAAQADYAALAIWRAEANRLREGATMTRLSSVLWRLCRGQEAAEAVTSALEILQPVGPSVELASAYATISATYTEAGRHADAIAMAKRAQDLAAALGAYDVLSDALNSEGGALWLAGSDDWRRPLNEALRLAVARGLHQQAGRAFANLHDVYGQDRQFAEAELIFTEGIAYCDDHDIGTYGTCMKGSRAIDLENAGRWEEAAALCEQLLGLVASPVNRIKPLLVLGRIQARQGNQAAARGLLDEAVTNAVGTGDAQWIGPARLALAEAHWLDGDLDLARQEAELACEVAAGLDPWDRGQAFTWLRRCGGDPAPTGDVAAPLACELDGFPEKAAKLWAGLGCGYDAALALAGTADERLLRAALATFADLGATAAERVTRQKMRKLGVKSIPVGPRSATRADPRGLTRREQEVLELLSEGLTNAEIAARLYISAKTVDHHVSAVLGKLGAPTRKAAIAQARTRKTG